MHDYAFKRFIAGINFIATRIRRYTNTSPVDVIVHTLAQLLVHLTLYYGFFLILPEIFSTSSWTVFILHYTWCLWLYIALQSNFLLIRRRHSSIRGRILIPPKEDSIKEHKSNLKTRLDAQNFNSDPINPIITNIEEAATSSHNTDASWHMCATCEILVPPRTWHCYDCNSCILRRDHHCVFAMQCIGEDNHCNFLGLLFYLSVATFYGSCFGYIRLVVMDRVEWYWWLFKCIVATYTLFIERSVLYTVMSINFTGFLASTAVFIYYFVLSMRGQTAADSSRCIKRHAPGGQKHSLKTLRAFLGSDPFFKIVWPFHQITRNQYGYMTNQGQGDESVKNM